MKKTYIVIAASVMLLFCLAYAGSYAYFSSEALHGGNFKGNMESSNVEDVVISDGAHVTSRTMIPGDEVRTVFTITNPNDVMVCLSLKWTGVINSFVNKDDLVIELRDQNNVVVGSGTFPEGDGEVLATSLHVLANSTNTYTLTITYQNMDENQVGDIGASFEGIIEGELGSC